MEGSNNKQAVLRFNIYFKYINSKIDELEKVFLKQRKIDLTQREFAYIALIGNYPSLSYGELVDLESISRSTFSNQIKILESKGMILQSNNNIEATDRRRKFLKLSESGKRIFELYKEIRQYFYDNYLSALTDYEKNELFRIGEKMANKMRELVKNNTNLVNEQE